MNIQHPTSNTLGGCQRQLGQGEQSRGSRVRRERFPLPLLTNPYHPPLSRTADAFTLVEMLLVVTMMGIVTLMSVPTLVQSIRGNRLRTATRTVVAAGKYARSMAVMKQQELRLVFHIDAGRIEVTGAGGSAVSTGGDELIENDRDEVEEKDEPQRGPSILSRELNKAQIEHVDIENEGMISEGSCSVVYGRNGRCTPYSVVLVDKRGGRQTITVDALSTARAEER